MFQVNHFRFIEYKILLHTVVREVGCEIPI
jgi:hypothetical protein